MKDWCKKYYVHIILVGLVAVVGGVAAYFYIDQFGANGFSNKSEDWANFATYISGTVGVAAVVATLIAFVITLRQQQKLINSQEEMLKEQRNQIKLVETQNSAYESGHKVNLAYSRAKEISPSLIRHFEKWPSTKIYPYLSIEPSLHEGFSDLFGSQGQYVEKFIHYPSLLSDILNSCPFEEVDSFFQRFFRPAEIIYKFVFEQVEIAPELGVYFESEFFSFDIDY